MELRLIQRLVRIMQKGEITELELDDQKEGVRLHMRRGPEASAAPAPVVHVVQGAGAPAGVVGAAPVAAAPGAGGGAGAPAPAAAAPQGTPYPSPMVGTFYSSPSPDADAFVKPGDRIEDETVLCIIEAMKVMNEIKAEITGEILEVLVENGEPVEFGQPLFLLK